MLKHTRDIAFLSGVVYFIQGALGISGVALPLFLRRLNWSVTEIATISSVAAFPWVIKIVYGLISDSFPLFGYRRKSYLILFSICSAVGWLLLILLPPYRSLILLAMMLSNLGFAATDVITDGLVVEHSNQFTSSIYQSIAWGSRSLGAMASGITGGWLAQHWEPKQVFLLTLTLPLLVCFVALWILEKKIEKPPFSSVWAPVKRCTGLLWTSNIRYFMIILFLASVSSAFGMPFFFFLKESLGFKETFLGLLASIGWGGAMLGSLIYVRWLRKSSPKTTLRWAVIFNSMNIFIALLIHDPVSAFVLVVLSGIMGCMVMLPIMSSAAALTHQTGVEGTLFAVLMSIFNLGQIIFGFFGAHVYTFTGLYPLIIGSGFMALTGLFFVEKLKFE